MRRCWATCTASACPRQQTLNPKLCMQDHGGFHDAAMLGNVYSFSMPMAGHGQALQRAGMRQVVLRSALAQAAIHLNGCGFGHALEPSSTPSACQQWDSS